MIKKREERNVWDYSYDELVTKYRKKFVEYNDRLDMRKIFQKAEVPIRVVIIAVLYIFSFKIYRLVVFESGVMDSNGPLAGLILCLTIVAPIAIERLINRQMTKYYQNKLYDLRREVNILNNELLARRQAERDEAEYLKKKIESENTKENQISENPREQAPLPAFLLRPMDEFSEKFIGKDMITVRDAKCKYATEIYGEVAENNPKVVKYGTYEINESHIYSKEGESSWYVISTMKTPSVRTSDLKNSVLAPYNLSRSFKTPETLILLPDGKSYDGYSSIKMNYMGSYDNYARQKGLDEAVVFCHVFSLGNEMYKDFILCARKGDYSWKLETIIPAKHQQILPPDFVPPGYFFGSFQTL